MTKVYLRAPEGTSRSIFRVANALERYAPLDVVEVTPNESDADLLILHVIGLDAVRYRPHQRCAVIQYCVNSATAEGSRPWHPLWERAVAIWSYYDLLPLLPDSCKQMDQLPGGRPKFYHAPLGIDAAFRQPGLQRERDIAIFTSGYVNGHGQEAIEAPTLAAQSLGLKTMHLGPLPTGFTREVRLNMIHKVSDATLANWYRRTKRVAALRYVEGFELPAAEGLACGARPVMFDRPEARRWFDGLVEFVPECDGDELTERLTWLLRRDPRPVSLPEREMVLDQFRWKPLATGFWDMLKEAL